MYCYYLGYPVSLNYQALNKAKDDIIQNLKCGGCGDGSGIKSACCSSRGPEFSYQHLHDCSQLPVISVPRDPAPFT